MLKDLLLLNGFCLSCSFIIFRRHLTSEMVTGRVDRPAGLPVGSRFFERPVKPVEKPVKFSFLATKRHLSTNRNILIYFIINETFYKKNSINLPHLSKTPIENTLKHLSKTPIENTCHKCRPPLWATAQSKIVQNIS